MINEDNTFISAENVMNDIYVLNINKNIDIDIIQEGLLKKVIGDEDSNSILFLEENSNSKHELTILNISLKVDEKNYIPNKQELRYTDIEVTIDFNKKEFIYSLDNSKLHKCHYFKLKNKLDCITKEKLNFKESILYLYNTINDKKFMKCPCCISEDSLTLNVENRTQLLHHNENNLKNQDNEKNDVKKSMIKDKCIDEKDAIEQKSISFLNKNIQSNDILSSFETNIYSNNEKNELNQKKQCKSYYSKGTPNEIIKCEYNNIKNINETKKEKNKEKNHLKRIHEDIDFLESKEINENGYELKICNKEINKKNDKVLFSLEDAEEISNFLKDNINKKNEPNNIIVEKSEKDIKKVEEKEEEGEEEKKKKKIMKNINESIPLTVMLSNKGNEICKKIIEKYSRYYRDFIEEKILGCGGFGYVMKVKNKRFNITYALKKITLNNYKKGNYMNTNFDINENENNSYIMEEAIMIAKLQHENIVRYYDAWVENNIDYYLYNEVLNKNENRKNKKKDIYMEEIKTLCNYYKKNKVTNINDKYLYILMEYCPGKTLREAIDCGFIYKNEKLIWELIKQILKGIAYIHDMKIMHRDIKPSNIFLQISDNILTAKIGDFGLTTKIDNNKINPSAGTVHYISPEQLNGEHFDQKADLFSLGVVFFEMFHEPFSTSMERSIVLSNLLKGIYPDYMKSDHKKFQFLSSLLAINPQDRSCAYSLLHDNFLFSFEKDFTEIYNLVENKRNCEEVHTIISTLFDKFDNMKEEKIKKKEDLLTFQTAKVFTEDTEIKKNIKKKIIKSLKNRGAIFIITPIILLNKYYIDFDNTFIDEYNSSYVNKKKENKIANIYVNTNKNKNYNNLFYMLDIYGNTITLRFSFFLSFSEYIYENIESYNKYNEANFFLKFYTYGFTYKSQIIKNKQIKRDLNSIYPEEVEKIFYCILISSKNIYGQEELNYLSIFSNADIIVSVYSLYNHISYFNKLLFVWSYIDLLPVILNECFEVPEDVSYELSIHLKKNSTILVNKSSISAIVQKYKTIDNISKISDYIFNLFQLKCENNKVDEYLNTLNKFILNILNKKDTLLNSKSSTTYMDISNVSSSLAKVSCDILNKNNNFHENKDEINKMKIFLLLDKVKKINNFIGTSSIIDNTCFDLFLNYEETVFSNEIIFYVISESKNKDIIAYGGKFDKIIQNMNSNNKNLLNIKAYGVEINLEKIYLKVIESTEKLSFNIQSNATSEKSQIFKNFFLSVDQNNFACTNQLIQPSLSNHLNYSSPKVLIQVYEITNLLIAYDLSKKLLSKNISSYTYFSLNANLKKKMKNFKPNKIQFVITIKSNSNDTSFNPLNPIKFNEVIYKVFNGNNQEYNYMQQDELINYIIKNI
ncbi:eukaryotic initiation factor 2alpha kinase 1, putative [Plasmodium gallinaceum]|uniref:Eukaryotic initiation factor 2alpha kinase 1, putative n=1 Tax=Plasmodium gallinaceum TaxID=5849 RepID=A0A1J1GUC2_PLAGA|nr:eukaryotic initiation factor 2alpha kinase 1, putative [Plasmodium gallinaceum]CRG94641.1 eukaryotic initiation factor 2alpha kinase 1, putative [Plasmodium gallinaceum]